LLSSEGHLCLHASAVAADGRGVAIVGPSGRGKSTLAALLCASGARLISDDMLRISLCTEGPDCFRGTTTLRLRSGAAELASELDGTAVCQTADGRIGARPRVVESACVRLGAILVPFPSRTASELAVEALNGRDALLEVLRYPRAVGWKDEAVVESHFLAAARVTQEVPVFGAAVPWGPPFPQRLARELLMAIGLDMAVDGRSGDS
jgi:hypothetical protein